MIFYYEGTHKMHIEIPEWSYAHGWQVLPLEGDGTLVVLAWGDGQSAVQPIMFSFCVAICHMMVILGQWERLFDHLEWSICFSSYPTFIFYSYTLNHMCIAFVDQLIILCRRKNIYDFQFLLMCTCKHTLHIFQRRGHFCVQLLWHLATIDFEWVCSHNYINLFRTEEKSLDFSEEINYYPSFPSHPSPAPPCVLAENKQSAPNIEGKLPQANIVEHALLHFRKRGITM